jgi:hypothetical protein
MRRLVQLLFNGFSQLVLVVAHPLRQDIIYYSPMIGIAFLHAEHDAVAPVITYVNGEKRISSIGNAAKVEFLQAIIDLDQPGEMDVLGEM